MTSLDWVIQNVTYRPHLYMCVDSSHNIRFHFYDTPPTNPGKRLQKIFTEGRVGWLLEQYW
jgi:hypothetical protein